MEFIELDRLPHKRTRGCGPSARINTKMKSVTFNKAVTEAVINGCSRAKVAFSSDPDGKEVRVKFIFDNSDNSPLWVSRTQKSKPYRAVVAIGRVVSKIKEMAGIDLMDYIEGKGETFDVELNGEEKSATITLFMEDKK